MAKSMIGLLRRVRVARLALPVCLLGFFAAAADAQTAASPEPGRFSVAAWTGYTATRAGCETCETNDNYNDTWTIGAAPLWRLNRHMLVGIELVVQPSSTQGVARSLYVLGSVQFHPWAAKGFFLKGGYGLARVRTWLRESDASQEGKFVGMAVNYGAGWHCRQEGRVSCALFGAHYVSTFGTVKLQGFDAVNVISNAWVAGVSVYVR
jgi:hypothetical protein